MLPVQDIQSLPAIRRRHHRKLMAELGLGQQADGLIVLRQ